jgi:hypothetical protein
VNKIKKYKKKSFVERNEYNSQKEKMYKRIFDSKDNLTRSSKRIN